MNRPPQTGVRRARAADALFHAIHQLYPKSTLELAKRLRSADSPFDGVGIGLKWAEKWKIRPANADPSAAYGWLSVRMLMTWRAIRKSRRLPNLLQTSERHFSGVAKRQGLASLRKTPDSMRHATWWVRFQIGRQTSAQIASSENVTEKAVAKAIARMTALLGLELRSKGRPGRPMRTD